MKLLGLAGLVLAAASNPVSAEFVPGSLLPANVGAVVDGWTVNNAGMDQDYDFYVTLKKGAVYQLAWIDPLGNVAQGTVDQVQVLAIRSASRHKGEVAVVGADCVMGKEQPIMAFFNARTGMARGYFIENESIVVKRWKTRRAQCQNTGS